MAETYQIPNSYHRLKSANYAAKVMAIGRQFMRAAEDEGLHKNTTYQSDKFKIKTSKVVLSFEELEGLYSLDLSKDQRLKRVRDLFLIGAYTWLRFSDFTRISPEHIEIAGGETVLNIIKMGKTHYPRRPPFFCYKFLS